MDLLLGNAGSPGEPNRSWWEARYFFVDEWPIANCGCLLPHAYRTGLHFYEGSCISWKMLCCVILKGPKVGAHIDNLLDITVHAFVCEGINKQRLETSEAWQSLFMRSHMLIFWRSRIQQVQVDFLPQGSWHPARSHKPCLPHNQNRAAGQRNEDKV